MYITSVCCMVFIWCKKVFLSDDHVKSISFWWSCMEEGGRMPLGMLERCQGPLYHTIVMHWPHRILPTVSGKHFIQEIKICIFWHQKHNANFYRTRVQSLATLVTKGRGPKKIDFFKEKVLNYRWVGVKSPKLLKMWKYVLLRVFISAMWVLNRGWVGGDQES